MIFVLFEVTVKEAFIKDYLALTAELREDLLKMPGFIRIERFSSMANKGKLLSLSVWENEQAVAAWRNKINHRIAQQQGRNLLFENYTIAIASALRVYSDKDREQAPLDSKDFFNDSSN